MVVFAVALFPIALDAHASAAFPAGDPVIAFHYAVDAVTHVKKFDQTIEVTGGTFVGGIDLETADLEGVLSLPTTEFTFTLAGIGLVTATAQIVPTQPVTGRVDFSHLPKIALTATAVFNIRIINAHATGTNLNLVGDSCTTASPVTVTISANANLDGPTTMAGEFTLPPFQDCGGLVTTTALTLAISGPGNTFTATATPP
jgi:hypothetical protein